MSKTQLFRHMLPLIAVVAILSSTPALKAQDLSKEGREQKAIHEHLFEAFLEGRKTVYTGTGRDRGLKELTILEETREIRHEDELMLPAGTERIASLFRHFGFHGADLDQIAEVRVFPFSPDKAPPRSKQVKEFYRVQMPSIPLSDEPFARMKIQFLMKRKDAVCRIDDLVFIAQKAIPPEFDSIPYRDLGSEFPREAVEVRIDTDHELSIGGTSQLQRDRWFRMHETPGTVHESFEKWAAQRGFLPGRGAFKFNPALTRGWGGGETLKEREDKPGAADLTFFEGYDAGERLRRTIPLFREKPFACCFNDWPPISLAVTNTGGRQIAVDLSGVAKRIGATRATQTRLNYHEGEVVLEPEHAVDAGAVPVDVNETTVIRLASDKPFAPSKTLRLDRWYATDTAVKSDGKPVSFDVKVDNPDAVQSVRLIVGVHRVGGVTEPPVIDMNGTPITVETGDASEFTEFFAPLDATVPISLLRDNNRIVITAQDGTTLTSAQLVTKRTID